MPYVHFRPEKLLRDSQRHAEPREREIQQGNFRAWLFRAQIACIPLGRMGIMTENERRAQDVLTREDLVLRGVAAIGLIAMALLVLLVVFP